MNKTYKMAMLAAIVIFSACSKVIVTDAGKVNMISNRNIEDDNNYQMLRAYAGGSTSELRRSRSKTIESAIDETVKQVPGGEFLKNAKVYIVKRKHEFNYAVQGDIWGTPVKDGEYNGFSIGESVLWNKSTNPKRIKTYPARLFP